MLLNTGGHYVPRDRKNAAQGETGRFGSRTGSMHAILVVLRGKKK